MLWASIDGIHPVCLCGEASVPAEPFVWSARSFPTINHTNNAELPRLGIINASSRIIRLAQNAVCFCGDLLSAILLKHRALSSDGACPMQPLALANCLLLRIGHIEHPLTYFDAGTDPQLASMPMSNLPAGITTFAAPRRGSLRVLRRAISINAHEWKPAQQMTPQAAHTT